MSRILLFSDSHGVAAAMKALRARVEADAPDLVCFLGDALYHGPRNGVPLDYDTKASCSISIPKGGSGPSYALLDGRLLKIRRLDDGGTLRVSSLLKVGQE